MTGSGVIALSKKMGGGGPPSVTKQGSGVTSVVEQC